MSKLGLIAGHSVLGIEPLDGLDRRVVSTAHGAVTLLDSGPVCFLQRHGADDYTTAAHVDHHANLAALAEAGCDRILAIGSVGSLRAELGVGSFHCPDDFIALQLGISFGTGHEGERVPAFDPEWRAELLSIWAAHGEAEVRDGGVYCQTIGPRFETPAEIRLLAAHADLVGMTIASECVLAGELGIPYAAVCVVDNLANGVAERPLTVDEFEAGKRANRERLVSDLERVVAATAGAGA